MASKKNEGQITLTQMLKALDKDVATGIERKLKKLSKKKAIKVPLDKNKADQVSRKVAYADVTKEVSQWEPIVERNRKAKQLKFPLDQEPDVLPPVAESVAELKPTNRLEEEVLGVIVDSKTALRDNAELTKAEEKYLKAISAEEAEERHKELQRMRVLLSSFGAKMRRQKAIKSKSYRRLLKHERLRKHMKRVESNKDSLMDEIERLQRLRAQERASLKHKNTGKWAKHAKFRAKYDEEARKAMYEQIGLSKKFLEKPAAEDETDDSEDTDDDADDDEDDEDLITDSEESNVSDTEEDEEDGVNKSQAATSDRPMILSSELNINDRLRSAQARSRKNSASNDDMETKGDSDDDDDDDNEMVADEEEEADDQRRLMSEAFADDDVVGEFQEAKNKLADEEQPKDVDSFLPGWGGWAGPGIKISKRKRRKYIIKAKKVERKDEKLGNVIISEEANSKMKELMVRKVPRGIRNDKQLGKILTQPTAATFIDQAHHRRSIRPRISTKMGARIEPLSKRALSVNGNKGAAKWGA